MGDPKNSVIAYIIGGFVFIGIVLVAVFSYNALAPEGIPTDLMYTAEQLTVALEIPEQWTATESENRLNIHPQDYTTPTYSTKAAGLLIVNEPESINACDGEICMESSVDEIMVGKTVYSAEWYQALYANESYNYSSFTAEVPTTNGTITLQGIYHTDEELEQLQSILETLQLR